MNTKRQEGRPVLVSRDSLADAIYDWTNNPQDRRSLGDYDIDSLVDHIMFVLGLDLT